MAVIRRSREIGAPDRTPEVVPISLSVTEDFAPGVKGFIERVRSIVVGLSITARKAATPPQTIRYPFEKLEMPERWRGPLRLEGIIGVDEIPLLIESPPEFNALIDRVQTAGQAPPCVGMCPANVDARGQSYLIAQDRAAEAYELVRSRNVMPGVLGRICHHPCEQACTRNRYDEPIAIRPLHRVAYERYAECRDERVKRLAITREGRVAIIGSGPSGLAAALDLMVLGYEVHMYEKDASPGGALRTGVPAYRLPREVIDREVEDLTTMGMRLMTGVEIGVDVPIDHLIGEYEAVLIAAGLQQSRLLPIPGADAEGVRGALEFLKAGNLLGDAGVQGKRVLVVGGGNVAVDCARVALRVGATSASLTSLESMDEMPAHAWEIEEALDEGVITLCSNGPREVLVRDGKVTGLRMQSCLSVFDAQGRFSPQFADEFSDVECDVIVFAIGQASDLVGLIGGSDLLLTDRGLLPVEGALLTTAMRSVFACGEVVTGPGSAIASIASGHEAATSIHRYLSGADIGAKRVFRPFVAPPHYADIDSSGVESARRRIEMPMAKGADRVADFRQVELGMSALEGTLEASRCLLCSSDVCSGCTFCARTCPDMAITVDRIDDPSNRHVSRYEFDISKCCFCGLCAEQCPTGALRHTGQYELSFYSRDLMTFDRSEMLRSGGGTRASGADAAGAMHVDGGGDRL